MIKSSRNARQIVKARRDAAKAHAKGLHTLASHGRLAGLAEADASGVGNAVRAKAKTLGVCGYTAVIVRRTAAGVRPVRGAKRYSKADLVTLLAAYKPRAGKYVAAKAALSAYATA